MLKRVGAWALWWTALFWLWMLLVGDWNRIEWVGGACAATVGATVVELIHVTARTSISVPLECVREAPAALWQVFPDFAILTSALARSLVRRRVVRGEYVVREHRVGDAERRAWTILVSGFSPNAYVVDIADESAEVLLHDLVRHRPSERPA